VLVVTPKQGNATRSDLASQIAKSTTRPGGDRRRSDPEVPVPLHSGHLGTPG